MAFLGLKAENRSLILEPENKTHDAIKPASEKESNTQPQDNSESDNCPNPSFTTINPLGGKKRPQRDKYEIQEFDERHELSFYLLMHMEKPIQQKHASRSDKDE